MSGDTDEEAVPSTRSYRKLHDEVRSRPGAAERLAALREATVAEIGLCELRTEALDRVAGEDETSIPIHIGEQHPRGT